MKYILVVTVLALAAPLLATTTVVRTDSTAQQIRLELVTNQAGNCTFTATEPLFLSGVADVNTSYFAGSNSDARSGSVIAGNHHIFILGTRSAQQATSDSNWHSRSLRANTPHTIGWTCGADNGSLVVSTQSQSWGNAWAEALPYDGAAPGGWAYPTINATTGDASVYIDPYTGTAVQRLTGVADSPTTQQYTVPSNGSGSYCSSAKVNNGQGWLCWFGTTSGAFNFFYMPSPGFVAGQAAAWPISSYIIPYEADKSYSCSTYPLDCNEYTGVFYNLDGSVPFDPANPLTSYLTVHNTAGVQMLYSATYNPAGNVGCSDPSGFMPYRPVTEVQSCQWTFTNLTRPSQAGGSLTARMQAFDARYDPNIFSTVNVFQVYSNQIILQSYSTQNSLGWIIYTDLAGNVLSMANTYADSADARWSGLHFTTAGPGQNGVYWSTENLLNGLCPSANTGCGPYGYSVTAINGSAMGTLSTTPTYTIGGCPGAGADAATLAAYGAFGTGCDILTLSGTEPCKGPTISSYESSNFPLCSWNSAYRGLKLTSTTFGSGQALRLADTMGDLGTYSNNNSEIMMVVGILSGNRVVVLRNYSPGTGPSLTDHNGTIQTHAANFNLFMAAGLSASSCYNFWNYSTDTHGLAQRCQYGTVFASHGDWFGSISTFTSDYTAQDHPGYNVCLLPGFGCATSGQTLGSPYAASILPAEWFGGYAGLGMYSGFSDNHTHVPRYPSLMPVVDQNTFLDMNKTGSFQFLYSGATFTSITGSLYKISGTPPPPGGINIKYRPYRAWSGSHNLKDVSGPGSSIGGASGDNWKVCYAYLANECQSGSSPGDVYMNSPSPYLTGGSCQGQSDAVNTPCFGWSSPELDNVTQYHVDRGVLQNGEAFRALGQSFAGNFATTSFANSRYVPDGSGAISDMILPARSDLYVWKVEPTTTFDSQVRSNFINVPVVLSGRSGDTVRVRFGYAEYAAPSALQCSARAESCATDSTGATPYLFASETQQWTACSSGCTLNVPTIPGRVVYYVVDRKNGSTTVSSPLNVAIVY